MKSIQEVLTSPWRGSERSAEMVREQVRERFGDEVADDFNPATDALPFTSLVAQGFVPRKHSRALKSIVIIEVKDKTTGEVIKKIRRVVNLFHKNDIVKIST